MSRKTCFSFSLALISIVARSWKIDSRSYSHGEKTALADQIILRSDKEALEKLSFKYQRSNEGVTRSQDGSTAKSQTSLQALSAYVINN